MNSVETKNIGANLIIEVLGRPPEHLIATLEDIANKIGEEKGVRVIKKKIKDPVPFEKQAGFFSSFMEIEVEVDEILYLALLMFKYMPAHIEIISPELITLENNGWNDILNELARRLHGYDEIARVMQNEKRLLEAKLRELLPEKGVETKKPVKKKVAKKKK